MADRLVTITEAAKALGISQPAVSQQVARYGIPRGEDGRFSLRAYKAAKAARRHATVDAPGKRRPGRPASGDQFAGAMATHKTVQTDLLRLKLAQESALLVSAAEVETRIRSSYTRFRSAMLDLPDRMTKLRGLTREQRGALETMIDEALVALARSLGASTSANDRADAA